MVLTAAVIAAWLGWAAAPVRAQVEESSDPPASLQLAPANRPTIELEISGPVRAAVGEQAVFTLKITNNGGTKLDNLLLVDEFGSGLAHKAGESPLEYELGTLGPGQTKTVEITFDVKSGGKQKQIVEVQRNDKLLTTSRVSIECSGAEAASTPSTPRPKSAVAAPVDTPDPAESPAVRKESKVGLPKEPAAPAAAKSTLKPTEPAAKPRAAGAAARDSSKPKASIRAVTPRDTKTPSPAEVRPPKRTDADAPLIGPVDIEMPSDPDASKPAASAAPKLAPAKRPKTSPRDPDEPRLNLIPEAESLLTPGSQSPGKSSGKAGSSKDAKSGGKSDDGEAKSSESGASRDEAPPRRFTLPPRPSKLQPAPKKPAEPAEGAAPGSSAPDSAPRESKSSLLPGVERPYYMLREPVFSAIPADHTAPAGAAGDGAALSWTVAAEDAPPPADRETQIDYGPPLVDDATPLQRLDEKQPLWIDKKSRKFVVLQGHVCNRTAPLELFACVRGAKEHESIVASPVRPSLCHAALLAVGAESGAPAKFQPRYEPARGDEIEITVVWRDAQNRRQTAKAQDWVRDVKKKKAMEHPWVFAGSRFYRDPDTKRDYYLADGEGSLICVSNFTTALLDLPIESTAVNDELLFQAYTERIPPVGTPLTLVLTPKKPAGKPAAPTSPAKSDAKTPASR